MGHRQLLFARFNLINVLLLFYSFFLIAETAVSKQSTDYFIENSGQWNKSIRYVYKSPQMNLIVSGNEIIYDYFSDTRNDAEQIIRTGHAVSIKLLNSNLNSKIISLSEPGPKFNYIKSTENGFVTYNNNSYTKIKINNIYDGIDFVLYFDNSKPRYDFIVAPGADPEQIAMKFEGIDKISTTKNSFNFSTQLGNIEHSGLLAYQSSPSIQAVKCSFKENENIVRFKVGKYDRTKELIIDPLVFSSYWGGSGQDSITSVASARYGEIVVCGWTNSENFPTSPGAYQELYETNKDVFVSKFKVFESSNSMVFSTLIGTSGDEVATAVAVDNNGDAVIIGYTNSKAYPAINGTGTGYVQDIDAFITKIKSDGSAIIYSSILGGRKDDIPTDLRIADDNAVYFCGYTSSDNFPLIAGAVQNKFGGLKDIFATKISSSGKTMEFSTYIGGSGDDKAWGMDLDDANNVFITGETASGDFPMAPFSTWGTWVIDQPYDYSFNGGTDIVAIKLISDGSKFEISSYMGGTADDRGLAIISEEDGTFYIAGETAKEPTKTFPSTDNAYNKNHNGGIDVFFAKMDKVKTTGNPPWITRKQDLAFSTFIGGSNNDYLSGLLREDATHSFYISGKTLSSSFPIVNSPGNKNSGSGEAFLTKFASSGGELIISTLYGGKGDDGSTGIVMDSRNDVYMAGNTTSSDLPLENCQIQKVYSGGIDGFIFKAATGDIKILIPAGGEGFCPGSKVDLKWIANDFVPSDSVKLEIKTTQDTSWRLIAKNVGTSTYSWTVPSDLPASSKYIIRISNRSGIFEISSIPFSILETPKYISILGDPANNEICEGSPFKISAKATGSNLKFQWFKNDVLIENAQDTVLIIPSATQNATYRFIASGTCNPAVSSDFLNLKVNAATKVLNQAKDTTIRKGTNITFTVNAKGTNLKYEWYKDQIKISFMDEALLKFDNANITNGGQYKCVVTGDCGIDSSYSFKLTVDTTTQISVEEFFGLNDNSAFRIMSHTSSSVTIKVQNSLGKDADFSLFDNEGRKIRSLYSGILNTEIITLNFDSENLSSGLYWINALIAKNKYSIKFVISD